MDITITLTNAQADAIRDEIGPTTTLPELKAAIELFVVNHANELSGKQRTSVMARLRELDPALAADLEAQARARLAEE